MTRPTNRKITIVKFYCPNRKLPFITKKRSKMPRGWTVGRKVGRGPSTPQITLYIEETPFVNFNSVQPSNRPTFFLLSENILFYYRTDLSNLMEQVGQVGRLDAF